MTPPTPTVTRTKRPGWVRTVARLMGWVPAARLDRDAILQAARRKARLHDWGGDDFIQALDLLLEGVRDGGLDTLGRMAAFDTFSHAVENRLHLEAAFAARPDIADQSVAAPIVIMGLHRTGTTLLHNLLALAPGLWAPPFWMLSTPAPLARPDKRRQRTVRMLRASRLVMPELKAVHPLTADSPEECWSLFMNTFCMLSYTLHFRIDRYTRWLLDHDMRGPYRHYRRQLQACLAQGPPGSRLVLKCPEHLWFLDALRAVFPDAICVWTHRDPLRSVCSYSSLSALNRRTIYGHFEPQRVGRHIRDAFQTGLTRAMAARETLGEDGFIDIHYRQLAADPVGVARRVLAEAGVASADTSRFGARASAWLQIQQADKRKRPHHYTSRQFGVVPQQVREAFSAYRERFDVADEPDI